MIYTSSYNSPIGKLLLASKGHQLIGLWIEDQKYFLHNIKEEMQKNDDEMEYADMNFMSFFGNRKLMCNRSAECGEK